MTTALPTKDGHLCFAGYLPERKSHSFLPKTILYSSWGYEQTNVNFYKVIDCTEKMVTLVEIGAHLTYTGDMQGSKLPDPTREIGNPIKRKVKNYGYDFVDINSSESACLWDGEEKQFTSYA